MRQARAALDECNAYPQAGMRECLASKVSASTAALKQAENEHCAFAASLGGGAIGSALEIKRLACVLELNLGRGEQLRTAASTLPSK